MKPEIPQIFSDGTIKSIDLSDSVLKMEFILYTEKEISIEFREVAASHIGPFWNIDGGIDGIIVKEKSNLLTRTIKELEEDEETNLNYHSFQVIDPFDKVFVEIIAKSITILD